MDSAKLFPIVTVLLIAASLVEANLTPVMMNWAR
ncbi:putative membrane protein SpoIIM required for sporulation [Paenibacillus sp. RC84]